MKVLIVNDCYETSSAAGAAVTMAEELARGGEEVHFLAAVQDPREAGAFVARGVRVRRVHVPPYPLRWRAYFSLNNRPAVRAFQGALSEVDPELVHFNNLHIHFSYASLCKAAAAGKPVVLTVHDVMPFCYQKMFCHLDEALLPGRPVEYKARFLKCMVCTRARYNPLRNRIIRARLSRCVDRLVAVSRPMQDALEQNRFRVHAVIPNGIDPDAWQPSKAEGERFRREHGLKDAKLLFHGGRLDLLKGGLHLVRALAALRPRFPQAKLMVLGKRSDFLDAMESLAQELDIANALYLPGWLEGRDLKAAYDAADVIATPSLCFESFNLINLEGMAKAKPVVSSFFGGPSEVVLDGETGFLVNPLRVDDLSDRISRLFASESLSIAMGKAGRRRVEEKYMLQSACLKLRDLYREIRPK